MGEETKRDLLSLPGPVVLGLEWARMLGPGPHLVQLTIWDMGVNDR